MLARFSLYGFLKNQRYHEPFFVLALREQGLSFLDIGILVGFGSICVNALEVPFGAVADVYGRRRCLLLALAAYVIAFALFGAAPGTPLLFVAMLAYSVGEAFRGGTHKAMIFDWLRAQGREAEASEVYGFTRSWSKRGSALSAVIGAVIALAMGSFSAAFWWTAIPYVLNAVNLAGYPAALDRAQPGASLRQVVRATWDGVRSAVRFAPLRRLLIESMLFDGSLRVSAAYLQPLVQISAIGLLAAGATADAASEFRITVIAAGVVYFVLGLVEAFGSARAGAFSRRAGGDAAAVRQLWFLHLGSGVILLASLVLGSAVLAIAMFVVQYGLARNLFRAAQLARYDAQCPPELAATVLSLESQAQALLVAIAAPLVGWMIDRAGAPVDDPRALWPTAAIAVVAALVFVVAGIRGATVSRPASD
ncbi:MAG: MFS transporter [Deltaproteobacteria bacterium]|nr:MFS transporter [Nannocystaceae bacterium]